jgi:glycosyltransferase involved in cell wall biosynthesis
MKNLTLVIPAKKESESLTKVLNELKPYNLKKIIVLEKKDKKTINSIKKFKKNILFQKNQGYGDALTLGIKKVKTKYFCIFNADGSFNPNELDNMLSTLINKKKDIIFASRYQDNATSDDDTLTTYVGNKIFSLIGKIFFGLKISDILYTYLIAKTKEVKQLNIKSKDFRFCVELPIKASRKKLKLFSVASHERARIGGKKKVNAFKDGFLILKKLIELYFD